MTRGAADTLLDRAPVVRRAARLTSALGVAFAVLFIAALLSLTQTPKLGASDAELVAFYSSGNHDLVFFGGLYLLPVAAVAFIWFIAALREWVAHATNASNRLLGTVQMLSGVSFITLAFTAAGAAAIVAASSGLSELPVDPTLARQFPLYGRAMLMVFGMRMAAIFVTSTAKIGHGAKIFPPWFVSISFAVAAGLFLVATLNVWLALVFPAWVLLLSFVIWQRSSRSLAGSTTR